MAETLYTEPRTEHMLENIIAKNCVERLREQMTVFQVDKMLNQPPRFYMFMESVTDSLKKYLGEVPDEDTTTLIDKMIEMLNKFKARVSVNG